MILINSSARFLGSGLIRAAVDTIYFKDTYLTAQNGIAICQAGHAGLDVRFHNTSVVGALNELKDNVVGTSGLVTAGVARFTQSIDSVAFVHNVTHNLNSWALNTVFYDKFPGSEPGVARQIFVNTYPLTLNTARVELDQAASGFIVIHA